MPLQFSFSEIAKNPAQQRNDSQARKRGKPPGLPEIGQNTQRHLRARLVPNPFAITCDYPEAIIPRWHVAIHRAAPGAGFNPISIQPFNAVTKTQALGCVKSWRGVTQFQTMLAWRNLQPGHFRAMKINRVV